MAYVEVLRGLGVIANNIETIIGFKDAVLGKYNAKELRILFEEVEDTDGITSQLRTLIEETGHTDAEKDWKKALEKLNVNLKKTEKFLQKANKMSAFARRNPIKLIRCRKDAAGHQFVLERSKRNVIDRVSIKSFQKLTQAGIKNPVDRCIQFESQASEKRRKYMVRESDLTDKRHLAKGTWGPLMRASFEKNQDVVIKTISDVGNQDVIDDFQREAYYLMELPELFVVKLIGLYDEDDVKFLVLEYMQKGGLDYLLHECAHETLEPKRRILMALDAAKAILYVNVLALYEGIETKRFLVDKYFNVKISGLKFAKTLSSYEISNIVNSTFYTSPEKYNHQQYTERDEVYRLGIVLWEILSRSKPFSTLGEAPSFDDVKKFVEGGQVEELTQDFGNPEWNSDLNNLVQKCRNLDPNLRPAVQEIVNELEFIVDAMESEELLQEKI